MSGIFSSIGNVVGGALTSGESRPFGIGMPYEAPVADQTQQMANNPIYGQESPFQPPMPTQTPAAPIDSSSTGGKSMGDGAVWQIANTLGNQLGSQIQSMASQSPNTQSNVLGNALANTVQQLPNQVINTAFSGGLKPAPANYRPPMRSGGILRRRMR